jgi:aryl-alcohol dehydrogenase-like predicted oxidoreductase
MIAKLPFGNTGHTSTRTIFGAAALAAMKPERCERVLETLLEFGVNHIDTAAIYGESELRLAPWMKTHRSDFFLATKTADRSGSEARRSLENSLERLGVNQIDLIQMHNLVDEPGWQEAMRKGGALEALIAAREEGLVRFIGVTGHGTQAPAMHLRSLGHFTFDSVLAPYNYSMMSQPGYAADFDKLENLCSQRQVALQTIKSVARRRWTGENGKRFSWYEPIKDGDAMRHNVHWVLARPGVFLNTSSDGTLLRDVLSAAAQFDAAPTEAEMIADHDRLDITPLFEPGLDAI